MIYGLPDNNLRHHHLYKLKSVCLKTNANFLLNKKHFSFAACRLWTPFKS